MNDLTASCITPLPHRVKRWEGFGEGHTPTPLGPPLFEDVRVALETYIRFGEPWVADICALWVLQAKIARYLPSVFYVYFAGSKGKGKTTALDVLAALTGGLNASDISPAAVVHYLYEHPYAPIFIDEADVRRDPDRDSALAAICRNGYTPGKPYLRWDPKNRAIDECPTYGAKALGYRSKADDGLEDRGFTLPLGEARGKEGADLVLRNFLRDLGDLPKRLDTWAASFAGVPSDARLDVVLRAEAQKESWSQKIAEVVGLQGIGANRETQLTGIALAVCRAAQIDLKDSLRAAFGLRREVAAANVNEDVEEARDVLEAMVSRVGTLTKEAPFYTIRQKDFSDTLNARRKEKHLRPLTSGRIARLRNDLGIRATWLTHPFNRTTWNIPVKEWEALLGHGVPNAPNAPNALGIDEDVSLVSLVSQGAHEPGPDPEDLFAGRKTRTDLYKEGHST